MQERKARKLDGKRERRRESQTESATKRAKGDVATQKKDSRAAKKGTRLFAGPVVVLSGMKCAKYVDMAISRYGQDWVIEPACAEIDCEYCPPHHKGEPLDDAAILQSLEAEGKDQLYWQLWAHHTESHAHLMAV